MRPRDARLREPPRRSATHGALAVAIGGFGLARVGMLRSMSTTATIAPAWLLALVLWPLVTAVPAFLVALVVATALTRLTPRA